MYEKNIYTYELVILPYANLTIKKIHEKKTKKKVKKIHENLKSNRINDLPENVKTHIVFICFE